MLNVKFSLSQGSPSQVDHDSFVEWDSDHILAAA